MSYQKHAGSVHLSQQGISIELDDNPQMQCVQKNIIRHNKHLLH